ncbi:MAG: ABC transporter permease subunit [Pseudomonadota bacterium]
MILKAAPALAIAVLIGPILCGLVVTILPSFGYFPALGGNEFSLDPWRQLFATPGLLRSCLISLATGLVTTLLALAVVAGFVAGWSHTRMFRAIQHLVSPLLSVPHAAAAFGLAFLFMPSGWIVRLFSPWPSGFERPPDWLIIHDPLGLAMMAGLFAKELPFLMLVTLAAMPQANPRPGSMIATGLGYGRTAGFLLAVWPSIYPQIRLAVFAVIAYASSVVDVALILGPTNPAPLAVRLVSWMNDPDLTVRFKASAGAVLQLGITAACLLIWVAGEKLFSLIFVRIRNSGRRFDRDRAVRLGFSVMMIATASAVFAGLFILALWSFSGFWPFPKAFPDELTFHTWQRQLPGIGQPLTTTILVGIAATVFALALALGCLEREARTGRTGGNRALALIYIPLIVPQASFVFGLQLFFLSVGLHASLYALILVHLVFVLPYVFLSLSDPWRAWDTRYAQAARTLGASRNSVFWQIRAPMLLRPILVASAVGFAVSIGQYLPTLLVGAGRWPTITTEAVALASSGDRRVIGVYAFIQMLLPFIGFAAATMVPALVFMRRRDMRAGS